MTTMPIIIAVDVRLFKSNRNKNVFDEQKNITKHRRFAFYLLSFRFLVHRFVVVSSNRSIILDTDILFASSIERDSVEWVNIDRSIDNSIHHLIDERANRDDHYEFLSIDHRPVNNQNEENVLSNDKKQRVIEEDLNH